MSFSGEPSLQVCSGEGGTLSWCFFFFNRFLRFNISMMTKSANTFHWRIYDIANMFHWHAYPKLLASFIIVDIFNIIIDVFWVYHLIRPCITFDIQKDSCCVFSTINLCVPIPKKKTKNWHCISYSFVNFSILKYTPKNKKRSCYLYDIPFTTQHVKYANSCGAIRRVGTHNVEATQRNPIETGAGAWN